VGHRGRRPERRVGTAAVTRTSSGAPQRAPRTSCGHRGRDGNIRLGTAGSLSPVVEIWPDGTQTLLPGAQTFESPQGPGPLDSARVTGFRRPPPPAHHRRASSHQLCHGRALNSPQRRGVLSWKNWHSTAGGPASSSSNAGHRHHPRRLAIRSARAERRAVTLRELRASTRLSLFALLTTEEVARFISPPPSSVEGFNSSSRARSVTERRHVCLFCRDARQRTPRSASSRSGMTAA